MENEKIMIPKKFYAEQKKLVVAAPSGAVTSTGTLYIQESHVLTSVQVTGLDSIPIFCWLEYFYDRNETTAGEIVDAWWARNTNTYAPAKIINKRFDTEFSYMTFNVLNQSGTDAVVEFVVTISDKNTFQTQTYDFETDRGLWVFNDKFATTTGGTLIFDITPLEGTWIEIASFSTINDYTNVVHDTSIRIKDENGINIRALAGAAGAATVLFGPSYAVMSDDALSTTFTMGASNFKVHYPNFIRIECNDALAADDALSILFHAWIKSIKPTTALTGSGTEAREAGYTTFYDKVV